MQSAAHQIATNIRVAMVRKDVSSRQLAEAIHVHPSTMYRKLIKRSQSFTADELLNIAAALDVSPADLMAGAGEAA